ncbi:MAG: TrkA family potassium uptake protein, partial [Halobacteriales archaeon]
VHGDPETTSALEAASTRSAAVLVADAGDERNASIVLAARECAADLRVVTFVEEPEMADYLRYAGADEVFSPRQLLGETLAREVTVAVRAELGSAVEIGDDFNLVELPVQPDSELAGVTLAESGIRERTGANVIGLWDRGEFDPRPGPDARLAADAHLFVAGTAAQLERLKELTRSEERRRARGTVVIAGSGEVGSAVAQAVAKTPMRAVVVDVEDRPGVDVVGDATDAETLREAGIDTADSLVVALSNDTDTVLATLVARELNPDAQIVARADDDEAVGKIYRAGADYVLALATVSGRMAASAIIEEEEVLTPVRQLEIVRTTAPGLVGQSLAGADVRARTGCTIVAIERDDAVLTELDPELVIEAGDTLVVAGTDDAMHDFTALAQGGG